MADFDVDLFVIGAGSGGTGGMVIWPLFGTTNQILAALTLAILAVMLTRKRRPVLPILLHGDAVFANHPCSRTF